MDYPLIHLAEFEWDGKFLRYKTWIQIGKQNPRIIHTWILLFFNTGSCFTNGSVIHMERRQFGFKLMVIWSMLRYKAGDQMITPNLKKFVTFFAFFSDSLKEPFSILGMNLSVGWRHTWYPISREFIREFVCELKSDMQPNWMQFLPFEIVGYLCYVLWQRILQWIGDWLDTQSSMN